jgi:hypothetical protein|tara:strand:+ start:2415 stop:3626 length:1212 start_codon:yes stop_codon:yes gene_type:complete
LLLKKGIEVNKDLFKRVLNTKKTREYTVSEPTESTNKYQAEADFVASQKRISNTKGQESELAKDWDRFYAKGDRKTAQPNANSATPAKTRKLTAAQRSQIEAYNLSQKKALSSTSASIVSEASSNAPAASQAKLEGRRPSGVGSASLPGEEYNAGSAGQAQMGHHADAKAGAASLTGEDVSELAAGHAKMGHHVDGNAGFARLEGDEPTEVEVGNVAMGHHTGVNAEFVTLEGETGAEMGAGNAAMGHHAEVDAGNAVMGHHAEVDAGNAVMGHHAEVGAGNAAMGHHTDVQAAPVGLYGETEHQAAVTQANMGHQKSKEASEDHLEGRDPTSTSQVNLAGVAALSTPQPSTPMKDVEDAVQDEENQESASSGRLAKKMSKIRSQSADITTDSEALQERNDKP